MAEGQPEEDAIVAEVEQPEIEADAEVAEEAEGEEQAKVEEPTEPEDSSPPKKDGKQRIKELNTKFREAERERDYWKEQAREPVSQPATVEPGKSLADFEYDEGKYTEYLTNKATADATADVDRKLAQDRTARSQSEFAGKEADFSEDVDDYHIVTRSNDLRITGEMVEVLQGSDDGPATLYYLGKNPEVADRLSRMNPLAMARELGRIEATKLKVEKPPSVTKAPAPTPKLSAVEKSSTVKADAPESDDLSTEDWVKRRNKQVAAR